MLLNYRPTPQFYFSWLTLEVNLIVKIINLFSIISPVLQCRPNALSLRETGRQDL